MDESCRRRLPADLPVREPVVHRRVHRAARRAGAVSLGGSWRYAIGVGAGFTEVMERDLDLSKLLEMGDPPRATPESLEQVVRRRRSFRARRYRMVASCGVVVALAAAGIGVGLGESNSSNHPAQASGPPPGLKWNAATAPVTGAGATAPLAATHGASSGPSSTATEAAPGEFGFVVAASSGREPSGRSVLPAVTYTDAGSAPQQSHECSGTCEPVFTPDHPQVVFIRRVDGLTITAAQVSFSFPVELGSGPVGTKARSVPLSSGTGSAIATGSSGTSSSGSPASSGSPTSGVRPIRGICPSSTELEVTISGGGGVETLFVPAGGVGIHAFSVLASAAAHLPNGQVVVLAVTRTSPQVGFVEASFASGRSDAMAPKDAWSVLAEVLPAATNLYTAGAVRLVATSSSGARIETATLPSAGSLATASNLVCRYLAEPLNSVGPAVPPSSSRTPRSTVSPLASPPVSTTTRAAG